MSATITTRDMLHAIRKVSVLCISGRGHYPELVGAENCWNEDRDARTYDLDDAVVAHPPCGPWGQLSHLCTKQDKEVAHYCVDAVRRCGGVLEHPAHSKLWTHHDIPRPGFFPDAFGGFTVETSLGAFGAPVYKRTWLYVVRPVGPFRVPMRTTPITRTVESLSSWQRQVTPLPMANWLIDLASSTTMSEVLFR